MRRRVLGLVASACFVGSASCGSGEGAGSPGAAGSAITGGTAGQPPNGTSGKGGAAGGKSNAGGGMSGGDHASGGSASGAGGTAAGQGGGASAGGMAGAGAAGGAGKLTGTPIVYVGGYGANYPVRAYNIDKATGALTQRGGDFDAGADPSYLTLDPSRSHLYAANENDGQEGGITALAIDESGALKKLNHRTGSDKGFTYVAVAPGGKFVLGASYNGGSVSVFPLTADGAIDPEVDSADFGANSQAHAVGFDKTGSYVLVPTKGANQIQQLVLGQDGMLTANTPPNVASAAGAGPRHIAVHPSGKLAFVVNEQSSTLTPYQLSADGKLTAGSSISTLPLDFNGESKGAHVELSPDGRFVYASNRGHDSVAVFSVDQSTGSLTLVEHESTRGRTPRDFDVDPNGDVLIVANQDSASLSVYKIEADGAISPLGSPTPSAPMPSAVQIHYVP